MSQTILGIDWGTYSVKILRLERQAQDLTILDYVEENVTGYARLSREEIIKTVLQKIFAERSLTADVVSMSLSGQWISSRVIELPFHQAKKINQMIDFEIEALIPFPIEDVILDYHVLDSSPNQSRVLCVYTPETNLQKELDALAQVPLDPKYLGADFLDLAGITQIAVVPQEGTYAICDIGHSKTSFLYMDGRQIKYGRTIGVGGHHFTRAIQRGFNLNFEKAEALKLSRGKLLIRAEESDRISRWLHRVARELVSSIKQTMMAMMHHTDRVDIPVIYCCGGGSRLVGLTEFLSFHLRANVFELDVLNFVHHSFEDAESINRIIPQVLAQAIKPVSPHRSSRVNFRKGPYVFKQELQIITQEFKAIAALLVAIVILGIGYYFYADYRYTQKMAMIEQSIIKEFPDLKPVKGKKEKSAANSKKLLKDYLAAANKKLDELRAQISNGNQDATVIAVMTNISALLPPKSEVNFEVREFNFVEDSIKLTATTNDTLNVEKIVGALKASDNFVKVESSDAQAKPGNRWDFTVKIELKKSAELASEAGE